MYKSLLLLAAILSMASCNRNDGIFWSPDETQHRVNALQNIHMEQQQQERTLEVRQQQLRQTQERTRKIY